MNAQNFEEKWKQMTKPEVDQLKHQDMLGNAIANAKDKSVVSWWWLTIPLYLIAIFYPAALRPYTLQVKSGLMF